jgi:hypothetical protein
LVSKETKERRKGSSREIVAGYDATEVPPGINRNITLKVVQDAVSVVKFELLINLKTAKQTD